MKFINRHCWVKDMGKEWQVWLNYALFLSYAKEDKASHRFATACLVLARAGSKAAIGEAFGYHRNYVAQLGAELQNPGQNITCSTGRRGQSRDRAGGSLKPLTRMRYGILS